MSKNRRNPAVGNKRRHESPPLSQAAEEATQRIRIPARKKKFTYEDELTLTTMDPIARTPSPARSEDDPPVSVAHMEMHAGLTSHIAVPPQLYRGIPLDSAPKSDNGNDADNEEPRPSNRGRGSASKRKQVVANGPVSVAQPQRRVGNRDRDYVTRSQKRNAVSEDLVHHPLASPFTQPLSSLEAPVSRKGVVESNINQLMSSDTMGDVHSIKKTPVSNEESFYEDGRGSYSYSHSRTHGSSDIRHLDARDTRPRGNWADGLPTISKSLIFDRDAYAEAEHITHRSSYRNDANVENPTTSPLAKPKSHRHSLDKEAKRSQEEYTTHDDLEEAPHNQDPRGGRSPTPHEQDDSDDLTPTKDSVRGHSTKRSSSWNLESDESGVFSTDEDRDDRRLSKNDVDDPNKTPTRKTVDAKALVSNVGVPSPQGLDDFEIHDVTLEDYDEELVPKLESCTMKVAYGSSNLYNAADTFFLDLVEVVRDLSEKEALMIRSAHNFKHSVPFANIALCDPYLFTTDAGSRLVWNNQFLSDNDPSMAGDKPRNVVGIMVGHVSVVNLKTPIVLGPKYMTKRIGIRPCEMALKRMVQMMGTKTGWGSLKVSLDEQQSIITFSAKAGGAGVVNVGVQSPQAAAKRYTRRAKSSAAAQESSTKLTGIAAGYYPSFVGLDSEVKIYDARGTDFVFDGDHLDKVHDLPEYKTWSADGELNTRCIVAIGYTLNVYNIPSAVGTKDCPNLSTNLQFVVLLGVLPHDS